MAINPKGYVPVLVLDSGEAVTENIAVLSWIASQASAPAPAGPLGHIRLLEALAFISTEVHKGFKPFITHRAPDQWANASETISKRLEFISADFRGPYSIWLSLPVDSRRSLPLEVSRQIRLTIPSGFSYFQRMMASDHCARPAEEGLS